jgi:tetratricopeptide (TPR) repeat protein
MKKVFVFIVFFFAVFTCGCKTDDDLSFEKKGDQAYENRLYHNAIHCWNRSYQDNPENSFLLYKTGKAFLKLGDIDKALEYFLRADKKLSDQFEIKKDIIRIYIIKGENKKALKLLEDSSSLMKSDYEYFFLSGDIFIVSDNPDKACQMYKEAVLLSGGTAKSFIKLAIGLLETENTEDAEKYISKVVKNYVLNPEENILLSDYYFVKGDIPLSEKYILEAVFSDTANMEFKVHLCSFYFKTDQILKACEVLEEYIKEYPENIQFKILLADALVTLKNLDKAELLLEEIKVSSGKNPADYNLVMGKFWLFKGRISYAVSYLKDACEKKPYLVNANYLLGTAYFAGGQFKLAENSLTRALVLAPDHSDSIYLMALLHYKQEEFDLCLEYLKKIEGADFFNPKYYTLKGLCFFEKGDFEKSSDFFMKAFELERGLSSGFFLGKARESLKDYDSAIDVYKAVLNEKGFNGEVFYRYISLLVKTGKGKTAENELNKFILHDGKDPARNYVFACLAIKLNNLKTAENLLKKAIVEGYAFEGTYLRLASIFKGSERLSEVEKILTDCLEKFPGCSECVLELADYYHGRNELDKACQIYEKFLSYSSGLPVLLSNYAWVLSASGKDLDLALDYARKAYELDPNQAFICDTLGYIYYLKGAYSQSLWMLEKAELMSSAKGILNYHLGLVQFKTGQLSKAKINFETAMEQDIPAEIKSEIEAVLKSFGSEKETVMYSDSPENNIFIFPEKLVDDTDILTPQWN